MTHPEPFPVVQAAKAIIRAELDLYHAQHGHPRPVTGPDLWNSYDAAWRTMGYPPPAPEEAKP